MKPPEGPNIFGSCIDTIYESDLDEENNSGTEAPAVLERRRKLHTEAEQRRRNSIKLGFQALLELVYPVKNGVHPSGTRMSKSTILTRSINAIEKTERQINQKLAELEKMDLEVQTLRIMNTCYEKYAHQNSETEAKPVTSISEDMKLKVFQMFADTLFTSFDSMVNLAPLPDFSGSIINWIETSCKPERLSHLMESVLAHAFNGTAVPASSYSFPSDSLGTGVGNAPNGLPSIPVSVETWNVPAARRSSACQLSQDWLAHHHSTSTVPVISAPGSTSSSTSSSCTHRYAVQNDPNVRDSTSVPFDCGHTAMLDSTVPDRPSESDFTRSSTYALNPMGLASSSTASTSSPKLIVSAAATPACRISEMRLSAEGPTLPQPPPLSLPCFPSQTGSSDACFQPRNAASNFNRGFPQSHSIATDSSNIFTRGLTHEDNKTSGVVSATTVSSTGNVNNNNSCGVTTTRTNDDNNNNTIFRSHFFYPPDSRDEPSVLASGTISGPRRSFHTESSRAGDLRVRYKQFF